MDNDQTEIIEEVKPDEAAVEVKPDEAAMEEDPDEIVEKVSPDEVVEETDGKKKYPAQVVLTIRTIVGAYVMYLAYQIITSDEKITPFMWVCVAIFIVAGAALVIMSVKSFIKGEYEGGKKDV